MEYTTLASEDLQKKVTKALKAKGYEVYLVKDRGEALSKIKELIPKGASVMNGSSVTLEEIGYIEYLKGGQHGWKNLKDDILAEKDPAKQVQLRRLSLISDYYLGSVSALSLTGEFVNGSNTGSQLSHIVYSSPNLIFVIGAQKIVPTLDEARKRLREYVVPLEDNHMMQKYKVHTALNKEVISHGEFGKSGRKLHFILVNEKLGF